MRNLDLFNKSLAGIRRSRSLYRALGILLSPVPDSEHGFDFLSATAAEVLAAKPAEMAPDAWVTLLRTCSVHLMGDPTAGYNHATAAKMWILSGMVSSGVKMFCPSLDEATALSKVDVNLPWSMYRQPFDTFCILLPDGLFRSSISEEIGIPYACIVRRGEEVGVISTTIESSSGCSLIGRYSWKPGATETIDQYMDRIEAAPTTDAEESMNRTVHRITLNACLMLVHAGCVHQGKLDPASVVGAEEKLRKRGLPASVRKANEDAIALSPDVYSFHQHIRLYETDRGVAVPGDGTAATTKPHWRRGHWAQQACGAGLLERKTIYRRAVFVNAALFVGDPMDTRVTLETS